jgi:hypothetical protein
LRLRAPRDVALEFHVVVKQTMIKQTLSWLRSWALHDLPAVHGELSLSLLVRHGVGDLATSSR